jgi:lipid A 4'-phosphatase
MLQQRFLGIPIGLLILFLAFAVLMLAVPQLDLDLSGLFYTPGAGFEIRDQLWERVIYRSVSVLMVTVNLGLIALWLLNRRTGRGLLGFDGRKLAFLLCLLALLPGLLVNQVLKEHWGRARPADVTEFGGQSRFTPAFVHSDQEGGSFCSGHAAAAFYLVAVAATVFGTRSRWVALAVLYALLVGFGRFAAGGHFISDVITSGFLVLFGYLVLHRLFFGERHKTAAPS